MGSVWPLQRGLVLKLRTAHFNSDITGVPHTVPCDSPCGQNLEIRVVRSLDSSGEGARHLQRRNHLHRQNDT